ncbi:MAG TPA: DUF4932 domain-containing protein [Mucilaginibacter sp.]
MPLIYKLTLKALLAFMPLLFISNLYAQNAVPLKNYTLKANADSFQVIESNYTYGKRAIKNNTDTLGFGTDLFSNVITVKTDIDSVNIRYNPQYEPNEQLTQVNIITPHYRQVIYYYFHEMRSKFSREYMSRAAGAVQYEIPETYELANILYALTKSSDGNSNRTLKSTAYFKEVQRYFSKYKDDPIFKALQFDDSKQGTLNYFSFRENSFCFMFNGNQLVPNRQYNIVYGETKDNLFKKLVPLITAFVKRSNFRQFYKQHQAYYQKQVAAEKKFMPVDKMKKWLERNFSTRVQSYRVVFSPLILGSHSTQKFFWFTEKSAVFNESVMFVSGMEVFNNDTGLTDTKKEGVASGIVFTEVDHNYCNPVSDKYEKQIDSALSNRKLWIAVNGDGSIYDTPESIFNEYITHGVFMLYCYDTFKDPADFDLIKQNRESLMVNHRKYLQFKAFDEMLLELYRNRTPGKTISDLYPDIINWCKQHN